MLLPQGGDLVGFHAGTEKTGRFSRLGQPCRLDLPDAIVPRPSPFHQGIPLAVFSVGQVSQQHLVAAVALACVVADELNHPLARRPQLSLADLTPYTRYSFEQGTSNSFYYAEEPFNQIPHKKEIRFSDRGTLTNLLTNHIGYTLSTGVLSSEMHTGIVSIPLDTRGLPGSNGTMQVGYIIHSQMKRSPLLEDYISMLENVMRNNPFVHPYKH